MKKLLVITACTALLGAAGGAMAAGDAAAGQAKSATCAGCHGADGNSVNPIWPTLAGQGADYIVKQLQDFKAGRRNNPTMSPMAAPLSDQDMEDLAAYFSSQTAKVGSVADAASVAGGEKLFRGGNTATGVSACAGCHGPAGTGNPAAKFPRLSGQHAAYTEAQLQAFKAGERANDAGAMMRNIATKMTADEMKAVAAYINALN